MPSKQPIRTAYDEGDVMPVELHDGSTVLLRKVSKDYNPQNRAQAYSYLHDHQKLGEVVTGLLYIDEKQRDMHEVSDPMAAPLRELPYADLCPGSKTLSDIQDRFR